MKDFVEQELHLDFKFDSLINPRIDCSQSPLAVRLSPEEVLPSICTGRMWPLSTGKRRNGRCGNPPSRTE